MPTQNQTSSVDCNMATKICLISSPLRISLFRCFYILCNFLRWLKIFAVFTRRHTPRINGGPQNVAFRPSIYTTHCRTANASFLSAPCIGVAVANEIKAGSVALFSTFLLSPLGVVCCRPKTRRQMTHLKINDSHYLPAGNTVVNYCEQKWR